MMSYNAKKVQLMMRLNDLQKVYYMLLFEQAVLDMGYVTSEIAKAEIELDQLNESRGTKMKKEFILTEQEINELCAENDEALRNLAEIEADEKKASQRLYILTEEDRPIYTRARLDLPMFYTTPDNPITLRQELNESAEQFGEANPDLDTLSDEAIFELADWYEYLWTK